MSEGSGCNYRCAVWPSNPGSGEGEIFNASLDEQFVSSGAAFTSRVEAASHCPCLKIGGAQGGCTSGSQADKIR
jgi:hypothetical protein